MYKKDQYKKAPGDNDVKMIDDITGFANYSSNMVINYAFNTDGRNPAQIITTEDNLDPIWPTIVKRFVPEIFRPKDVRPSDYDSAVVIPVCQKQFNPATGQFQPIRFDETTFEWVFV